MLNTNDHYLGLYLEGIDGWAKAFLTPEDILE